MLKIRRRWRDRVGLRLVVHIVEVAALIMIVFGWACGLCRIEGDGEGVADGDLVLYARAKWQIMSDDEVLCRTEGQMKITKVSAMRGGEIYGRVLARLQVRGFGDATTSR